MAEVLVTGGAGFIGSHVVDHLVGAGRRVVVLGDFSNPGAECVEGSIVDHRAARAARQSRKFGNIEIRKNLPPSWAEAENEPE